MASRVHLILVSVNLEEFSSLEGADQSLNDVGVPLRDPKDSEAAKKITRALGAFQFVDEGRLQSLVAQ